MRANDKASEGPLNEQAIEARLRALPKPPVPSGLEQRLLAGIPPAQPIAKPRLQAAWGWAAAGTAVAAAVILAGILAVPQERVRAPQSEAASAADMSEDDMQQAIEREGIAARLLASADILGAYPEGKHYAVKVREYAVRAYADTATAKRIVDSKPHE